MTMTYYIVYMYAYNNYVHIPTALMCCQKMMTSSSARWLGIPFGRPTGRERGALGGLGTNLRRALGALGALGVGSAMSTLW